MSWKDELRNPNCTLCPLHAGADHVCLMGSGKRASDIMIIGEAPGAREDEAHRAFVGPAGKLLRHVLPQVGIQPEDCYITNVAKCRPPKNRTPEWGKETKVCVKSYLVPEFEAVRPSFVLLLGNPALKSVVGKSGITKYNGTVWEIEIADGHNAKVMATLHPAAVLRNPKWQETFSADLVRFGNLIKGIDTSPKTIIKYVTTAKHLKWFLQEFKDKPEISWDVETDTERDVPEPFVRGPGQDWHGDESLITSIALSHTPGTSYTFTIMHPRSPWKNPKQVLEAIKPIMLQKGTKYIAHNGKFDAIWMHSKGIPVRQHFDTMLAAHMLDENKLKGLKPLSKVKLAAEAYDIGEDVKNSRLYRPEETLPLQRS
jgi:uracil-DNA glycosylase family 4